MRRSVVSMILALAMLGAPVARGQVKNPAAEELSPQLDGAIARGLAYLAKQQQGDGSFQNRTGKDSFAGPKVALTGLAVMAYLSAGRTPDAGKHALVVRNAIDYLVKVSPEDGYFGKVDGSRMYGHAIATLALAEAAGMEVDEKQRAKVRAALVRATAVLIKAQKTQRSNESFRGGWRYEVEVPDSDLSVSSWCVLALRAAHNAGVDVPRESADRAAEFVLRCYDKEKRGFAYQPGAEPSVTMTGAGVLSLALLDRAGRREVDLGATFLIDHPVTEQTEYAYYARYYAAQAAFQVADERWPRVWKRTQDGLLKLQEKDGGWPGGRTEGEKGQTYTTALSVLTLGIPLRLLPAYQR
ncbi:MAG: prenyltransferase/squalene oxidase repeat-containing protein [Phycisphaerae bacterium]|nr:prenyltransferase/squalene oxidase repeat-containing protein [Tepidisphaeraceae bacterium]